MRIQIIVDCYLPSTKSSAKLVHDLGAEFRRQGHEVCIAAPDDALDAARLARVEQGLTVLRIRSPRIKGRSNVLRGVHEARLSSLMWREGRNFFRDHPCDLVVFYSPSIFFGPLVRRLKRLWNCPAYLVLRDIFPQWAVDAGVLRKGLAYQFCRYQELVQYRTADVIGVQSPGNLQYFFDRGWFDRFYLEVLYNWTTLDELDVPKTDYRRRWGLEGQTVFFYGGNIGVAQDMLNLVRLADRLRGDAGLHFLLVGEGSELPRLEAEIAARQLTNISIRPAVGQREYLGMLAEFDVGLITLDRHLRTQNLPGKMLGYLYHGLPILASVNPGNDLKDILEAHAAGLVCVNGDDDKLAECALRLARNTQLRERVGQNGRDLLERMFSVRRAAEQILSHVQPSPLPLRNSSVAARSAAHISL